MKKVISILLSVCMLFSMFATVMAEETEVTNSFDDLKQKTQFAISEANGANAKLFIDYVTYQEYNKNDSFTGEWVKGLDYSGIVNYSYDKDTNKDHTSYPTGTETDVLICNASGKELSNALIYKVDEQPATGKWGVTFVNLTTKNDVKTWTVDGVEFVINPLEKVIKTYTPTDASGVEDADLKARFATLNNPVLDVENGYYKSITLLVGVKGNRNFTPTVVYEDGSSKALSSILLKKESFTEGTNDDQDDGYMLLQTVTNWSNNSDGGTLQFQPVTLEGFDTAKKIDKLSFKSDGWGSEIFVISGYGETESIKDMLSVEITDLDNVKGTLALVDQILAENNATVDDLSTDMKAKYDALSFKLHTAGIDYTTVKNIPIAEYANSKMFTKFDDGEKFIEFDKGIATTEYDYFLDYINDITYNKIAVYDDFEGTTVRYGDKDYEVIKTWTHSPLPYSKTQSPANYARYIPLDSNNNWTINFDGEERTWNIDVDTNGKAIQLVNYSGYQTSQLTRADLEKTYLLSSATIDVEDGYYRNLNFLIHDASNNGVACKVYAEVEYADGSTETKRFIAKAPKTNGYTDFSTSSKGYLVTITPDSQQTGRIFICNTIDVNPAKKVDKVKLSLGGGKIVLISSQADTATVRNMIDALPEEVTGENYGTSSETVDAIDKLIAELDIDLSKDAELNSKYNAFLEKMQEAEKRVIVNKVKYENDTITVNASNFTGADASFELYALVYNEDNSQVLQKHMVKKTVEEGADCVDITENFKITAEGKYNLKIMVWEGLHNLKPLTEVYSGENKVYMFVGDSITHNDMYPMYVEAYFVTRFPEKNATFENAGRGGGSSGGAFKRYDYDIANRNATDAIVMFGMNDVRRESWPLAPEEEGYEIGLDARMTFVENSVKNTEKLVNRLRSEGMKVTIMTPSIYDTRADFTTKANYKGVNSALTAIAEKEKVLAPQIGVDLINLHDHMNEINNKFLTSGEEEMISTDRIHPNNVGHYVLAYNVINYLFKDTGLVASVTVDAANASVDAENATVKDVEIKDGVVKYYYAPNALPWHNGDNYIKAEKYVDLTNDLNREIIKVTGLEADATYTIKFNDVAVATATGAELAEGINIATIANNPGQVTSKKVYDKLLKKRNLVYGVRNHYVTYYNDGAAELDYAWIEEQNVQIKALAEEAREIARQPREYIVTISK